MKIILFFMLGLSVSIQAGSNYLDSLRPFWQGVYPQGGKTLYCQQKFAPFDRRINVEHIYPMAWVTKQLKCGNREQCRRRSARFNQIESDMHNMYAALKTINQVRGAMAFAELTHSKPYADCDLKLDYRKRKVDPPPYARGKIARAILYMADRYHLSLYKKQKKLMQKWNRLYPPDQDEKKHARAVQKIQGRSNPFIE